MEWNSNSTNPENQVANRLSCARVHQRFLQEKLDQLERMLLEVPSNLTSEQMTMLTRYHQIRARLQLRLHHFDVKIRDLIAEENLQLMHQMTMDLLMSPSQMMLDYPTSPQIMELEDGVDDLVEDLDRLNL